MDVDVDVDWDWDVDVDLVFFISLLVVRFCFIHFQILIDIINIILIHFIKDSKPNIHINIYQFLLYIVDTTLNKVFNDSNTNMIAYFCFLMDNDDKYDDIDIYG